MKGAPSEFDREKPPEFYQALRIRVVLLVVFLGAAGLLWWSVNRLGPLDRKLQDLGLEAARLEDEVMNLQSDVSPPVLERAAGELEETRKLLFARDGEMRDWREMIKERSRGYQLDFKSQQSSARSSPLPEKRLSLVTTTVELRPAGDEAIAADDDTSYHRLIEILDLLAAQKQRVDLIECVVSGNLNSIHRAEATLQLWSVEEAIK